MAEPLLFAPLSLRSLELPHRGWVSPMCQYSCEPGETEGVPTDWHLVHLGSFAIGGAALILTEAAAVNAAGRISPRDAGIYNDAQTQSWRRITDFVHNNTNAKIGVQLAHAGRKASTYWPFSGKTGSVEAADGGWQSVGPSPIAYDGYATPREMTEEDIQAVIADFEAAALRAVEAGFDTVEIHGAHGYLLHQFQSPIINHRRDGWSGDEPGRNRLMLAVVDAVREAIPEGMPLLLRISATDWADDGVDLDASVRLAAQAGGHGVDLIDVSSGGAVAHQNVHPSPGYQTAFAATIREQAGVPTGTVGMITTAQQAEHILVSGQADAIFLARAALRDPHWWLRAGVELGSRQDDWLPQYQRAYPRRSY